MLIASDIMTTDVISVSPETEIVQAARTMIEKRINGLPVVDGKGRVVGILCQSDLVAQQKKLPVPTLFTFLDGVFQLTSGPQLEKQVRKIAALSVADAMSKDPVSVGPDTGIEAIAALMVDSRFHSIPVVEGKTVVGIIGKADVLRTLLPNAGETG